MKAYNSRTHLECIVNLFWIYTPSGFTRLAGLTNFIVEKLLSKWSVLFGRSFIGHRSIWYSNLPGSWPVCSSTWYTSLLSWCISFSYSFFFSLLATLLCCVFNFYLNHDELELRQIIRRFSLKQMHSSRNILPNFICFVTGILSAYWYWIDYFPANSTSLWLGVSIYKFLLTRL